MHSRYHSQRNRYRNIVIPLVLGLVGCYWFWASSGATAPHSALSQARDLSARGRLEQARSMLSTAASEERIAHWVALESARIYESEREYAKAFEEYGNISSETPASLDARLALVRLKELGSVSVPGSVLAKLEQDIRKTGRTDLIPELRLLQARDIAEAQEAERAYALYRELRTQFSQSPQVKTAREEMNRLRAEHSQQLASESMPTLLEESKLLMNEGESMDALDFVQRAKSKTVEGSPAYFEALAVEEQLLRKLKRNEEADHMLLIISADAGPGVADAALLKVARNAWNLNDNQRALDFLSKLKKRYPLSPLRDEATYIEARILEESKLPVEAKELYRTLGLGAASAEYKRHGLKRLAWLYYRNQNLPHAAQTFRKLIEQTEAEQKELSQLTASERTPSLEQRVLQDEIESAHNHALFWLGSTLSRLDAPMLKEYKLEDVSVEETFTKLAEQSPLSYYTLLASYSQQKPFPSFRGQIKKLDKNCYAPVSKGLKATLEALSELELRDLARYEINWYATKRMLPQESISELVAGRRTAPTPEELPKYLTLASLYQMSENAKFGIELARVLTSSYAKEQSAASCAGELNRLLFPMPHKPAFDEAAAKHKIEPALLFAVARTESKFDILAESRTGAKGLTQLMPATAKQEGLGSGQDIFAPAVNVNLGARYLAGLLKNYSGELVPAIAAYNAGPSSVERWRERYPNLSAQEWTEMISYPETYKYVQRVMVAHAVYAAY